MSIPLKVAVIGAGRMGRRTAQAVADDPAWELVAISDLNPEVRVELNDAFPGIRVTDDTPTILSDSTIEAVAITTLADVRPALMREALASGKHVWAEKPIAATVEEEAQLLELIEGSGLHVCVNLFNRNGQYHERMQAFIASGEIGDLASIRVRHQTPGLLPGGGHEPEGPPFHNCGMHYVDVVRWYAGSEFRDWDARGICFWGHPDPWWVDVHGTFENDIFFQVTNGFNFGQEADSPRTSCGLEIMGTKGVIVMEHDFRTVTVDLRGHTQTHLERFPYGGKKVDVMARRLAEAIQGGPVRYPTARDSVVASRVSWQMLEQAARNPSRWGKPGDLDHVLAHREKLRQREAAPAPG